MTGVVRPGTVLASLVLILGWSAPVTSGSGTPVSDPAAPAGATPTNSTSYAPVPSDFSLTISPTRLVIGQADLDPDAATVAEILVVNRGRAAVTVTVQKRNFSGGAAGELVFRETAPYSASDWVTVSPTSFAVAPGAAQTVTAAVRVAANPEPGDHQVAIVFLVPAGETGANIRINRGVATPLYVTVPGATDDSASLSGLQAPGFAMGGPVTISADVHNTGTVHRDFRGTTPLVVHAAGERVVFPDFTVMRGSTRHVITAWDPPFLCVCHPTVSVANTNGPMQTATVRVIVFPLHLLGAVVGTLLVLALMLYLWRRRYRANVLRAAARMNAPAGVV